MSINNATKFIREVNINADFRKSCNKLGTKEAIHSMLKEQKADFSETDFEEAINMLLFKCQTYEQADTVKQIEWWYSAFDL
jgi:hypothetical protein